MLPFYNNVNKSNKTIYINPNFKGELPSAQSQLASRSIIPKNAHINPLFLEAQKYKATIHMNPAFIQKFQIPQQKASEELAVENEPNMLAVYPGADNTSNNICEQIIATDARKIICKTKNRLIREPLVKIQDQSLNFTKCLFPKQPLLVLSRRKLIRKVSNASGPHNKLEKKSVYESKARITKYKLDNRAIRKKPLFPPIPRIRRNCYVGQYALKRTISEALNKSASKSLSINKNKKLKVLNINGLLYKSTGNSLKLKDNTVPIAKSYKSNASSLQLSSNINQGLTIFVRGTKYVMDANKFKLTRVTNYEQSSPNARTRSNSFKRPSCQRIDIGGYTYVSLNSSKNVLIRTTNHLSRAYVHNAKQKSLQTLTKCMVKSNIPCPIFQRIGKCAAFKRGKCSKVHNKLQVAICSKFLRGECNNSKCLLSHNVSLSKMPACKFFLQGVCVRNDCPYLHKKLSSNAELCIDFLRGFCQMADKCNKRHEFVCPEIERNNKCNTKNCIYCKEKKRKDSLMGIKPENMKNKNETPITLSSPSNSADHIETKSCKRYFINSCTKSIENANENNDKTNNIDVTESLEENVGKNSIPRPKLGALPAYIPL